MVLEIVVTVLTDIIKDPIKKYIVLPMKQHIGYSFKCDNNVERLQDGVGLLKSKRVRLQQSVDDATRKGEEIFEDVTKWLVTADRAIDEAEELIQAKEEAKKRCFVGLCPNLKNRYRLSKKADETALAINKLRIEGRVDDSISYQPPPKQMVAPSVYTQEALPSRVSILKEVMDALKDSTLNIVGVYGMGGVGKTTLVKEVHRQAQDDKLFDLVIMVTVSVAPDLGRIQAEIAEVLGMDIGEEGLLVRANRLYERLKKEKDKKILIILDDVWRKLPLEEVGIPFGNDCGGCKIFITSRSQDILSRQMGTQKEFGLGVLTEEEAWTLFEKTVAEAKDPKFHDIATQIAKKCAGLPLLILIVATDLQKKQQLYAWNAKLQQLSELDNEEMYQKVHLVLESSYNNLPSNEAKSFFLLCGLFGKSNIRIQYLLRYSIGLRLFKHIGDVEGATDKVYTLIDDLKDKSLLLDGDLDGFVKMHDVVRDTAVSIASRVQHAFVGASGVGPSQRPSIDCTRIALPYSDIHELPEGLECPKAELLLLFTDDLCLKVPDLFFEGLKKLKVLDFTGIHFASLPSSLGFLTNLLTLCLHQCQLGDIAVIGELKQLEVLSFADSYIVELPRQITQLTQLRLLDLSNCSGLKVIPANVLSKLSLLEALHMSNSFVQWEVERINNQGNASLAELKDLSHLTTLELQVLDANIIPSTLFSKHRLQRYRIFIGDVWGWHGNCGTSRTLKLKLKTNIHLKHGIKMLLKETEELYLDEVRDIENVLYDLDGEGFPELKHLHIQNNSMMKYIINSMNRAQCHAFPILESLFLENLMSLENICHGHLAAGSLGNLRILKVQNCKKLISFSFSIAGEDDDNEVVEFTQLRSLALQNLPDFRSFCSRKKVSLGIEAKHEQLTTDPAFEESVSKDELGAQLSLFNNMVSFPSLEDLKLNSISCEKIWEEKLSSVSSNLTSLHLEKCGNLKHVFTTSIVKSLLQLKRLHISYCDSMEEIILTEAAIVGVEEEKRMNNKILFPKLDTLYLQSLPNLIRFCSGSGIEFQSLRELEISDCNAMTTFVPSRSMMVTIEAQKDGQESSMEIQSLFNEMVSFPNLERLELWSMHNLKNIWHYQFATDSFCKLKSLGIRSCPKLLTVFPSNVLGRFQRLEELDVYGCKWLQEIYQLEGFINVEAKFELQYLFMGGLPALKHIWSKDPQGVFTFQNLRAVNIDSCDLLKNVFPASIARDLSQLGYLRIVKSGVEEIVAMKVVEPAAPYFKFPQLTTLRLGDLQEMTSFYPAAHTSEWPKLKDLQVSNCHKGMKLGSKKCGYQAAERQIPIPQPLFLVEKVSSNLEEFTMEPKDLSGGHLQVEGFPKLRVIRLLSLRNESRPFLFGLLKRLYSLETIVVINGSLEELFSYEGLAEEEEHAGTLLRVKNLELFSVRDLKHIWKQESRSQPKPLFQIHLEALEIESCYSLINIAPSSSSFQNLATLEVSACGELKNLVTASTAKTMVQLQTMKVSNCKKMTEIVANNENQTEAEIVIFSKLKSLKLRKLPSLTRFCSGNHTFNLPSLQQVEVAECSQMKTFSHGDLSTPQLRGIQWGGNAGQLYWEGQLNATIACLSMKQVSTNFKVSLFPELWHGDIQGSLFYNVESLEVDECPFSSKAISNNVLQFLSKLRKIQIRDCDSVEAVFDLEEPSADDGNVGLLSQLRELHLVNLPMLSHICNNDLHWILDLKNLNLLNIRNCSRLKYAFTQSMAFCLVQLQEMKLENCKMMEALIKLEEAKDATSGNQITLPSLQKISINVCPNMKGLLSITSRKQNNPKTDFEGNKELLIQEVFPNLEELSLDGKSAKMIFQYEFPTEFFSKIKNLGVNKLFVSLFVLLPRLPKLETLGVSNSSLKELFQFEGLGGDQEESPCLPRVRALKLERLHALKHICKQDSPLRGQLFQHLETLKVRSCGNLIHLASSSTSFQNLTTLEVFGCNGLIKMLALSVAKSMVQLVTLSVECCEALMEIVGGEQDETTDEIVFTEMKKLRLVKLQRLTSFCSGTYTFKFPSLEQIIVGSCPNMKIFCPGVLSTPKLDTLNTMDFPAEPWPLDDNLNTIIQDLYNKLDGFVALEEVKLSKFPMLKEKWLGQFPFKKFERLRKLVVDECEFSNAISTRILPYLTNLRALVVEKCDSLDQVFVSEGLNAYKGAGLMNELNELQLIDLPRLKHVWIKDPQKVLSFENLNLLKVHNCSNLINIFTLSMAWSLVKLQHVEVKGCTCVEEIITKDVEGEAKWDKTIFPSLQSMGLESLPSLSSFYNASNVLIKFPSLKKIGIVDCPRIDLFASMFSKKQDSSLVVKGNEHFFGGKVAIPSLEELTLEWNSIKELWQQKYHAEFLCGLKAIKLVHFPADTAIFSSNLLQCLPNLERLVLSNASFNVLVPSLVPLQNLTTLEVSNCQGLVNLMSSSTARSLVKLRRMKIKECEMIREIVAAEADKTEDDIRFSQLEHLELHHLPCLASFCSGNSAFSFPSLEEVIVSKCPRMESFAQEILSTPKLWRVRTGEEEYEWEWEGSLNNTIQALFMEMNADKN